MNCVIIWLVQFGPFYLVHSLLHLDLFSKSALTGVTEPSVFLTYEHQTQLLCFTGSPLISPDLIPSLLISSDLVTPLIQWLISCSHILTDGDYLKKYFCTERIDSGKHSHIHHLLLIIPVTPYPPLLFAPSLLMTQCTYLYSSSYCCDLIEMHLLQRKQI